MKCHDASSLACSCLFGAISPRSSQCGGPPRRVIIPVPSSGTALFPLSPRLYTHQVHPSSVPVLGRLPVLLGPSDLILRCPFHVFTSPFPTGWKLLRLECV